MKVETSLEVIREMNRCAFALGFETGMVVGQAIVLWAQAIKDHYSLPYCHTCFVIVNQYDEIVTQACRLCRVPAL